jgi:hypothetical protein
MNALGAFAEAVVAQERQDPGRKILGATPVVHSDGHLGSTRRRRRADDH